MSAPRTKRPFAGAASDPAQRQITSFFSSSSSTPSSSLDASLSSSSLSYGSRASLLPASVQTNLLAVGMRVRKSVPEGYKTGASCGGGAFALWDESDCSAASAGAVSPSSSSLEGRSRANAFSSPRELLPFCGIHKVGGLATQPENVSLSSSSSAAVSPTLAAAVATTSYHHQQQQRSALNNHNHNHNHNVNSNSNGNLAAAVEDDNDEFLLPGLTSSQVSMVSTDSALSITTTTTTTAAAAAAAVGANNNNTRKRSFAEEDDEVSPETPDRLNIWRNAQYDGEISPRSLAPVGWGHGRVMAVPRKGRVGRNSNNGSNNNSNSNNRMGTPRETSMLPPINAAGPAAAVGLKGRLGGGDQENVMIVDDDFDEADFLDRNQSWEVEMSDI